MQNSNCTCGFKGCITHPELPVREPLVDEVDLLKRALSIAANRLLVLYHRNRVLGEHPDRLKEADSFYREAKKALEKGQK